ncbi:flagellar hook-associated protein 3 [Desulfofundulus kuznetsovii DSM 6115]|uniref:Flagellar hook-associated protein 3 n=1 Tax=Desulfofundulus kuznetsovii (strain DSM 6115 / VKM B-1805 / 17) TaxID=760568 RepID=A0AAU8PI66_DESK7|nr:flagellar hook-associated protein 3 [Desulfofundulus kuznetsovii DSM 6115]
MRVTHMLVARRTQNYIQDAMQRLARTQEQMSTGRKVLRLSDDPPALSQLLNVRTAVERNQQYMRNITDGLSYLDGADTALGTAGELLQKAIEYAIQGANGTLEPDDMAAIGEQIDKMIDELVDIANTTVGGKYIFAGTKNDRPPFWRDGDKIYYRGNLERVSREILDQANYTIDVPSVTYAAVDLGRPLDGGTGIGKDETQANTGGKLIINGVDVPFSAGESYADIADRITKTVPGVWAAFVDNGSGNQNAFIIKSASGTLSVKENSDGTLGVSTTFASHPETEDVVPGVFGFYNENSHEVVGGVFDVLINLAQSLKDGDVAGVQRSIGELNDQLDHILRYRVQVGARTNHFESVRSQLQDQEVRLTQVLSNLEDADVARVAVDLSRQQLAYQAALAAGARILETSLLDYLR